MTDRPNQTDDSDPPPGQLATRGDLTRFLVELAGHVRADSYMLLALVHENDRVDARILASNWIFDAIELAGQRLLANLAASPMAAGPGMRLVPIRTSGAPELPGLVTGEEARLLHVLGHREIYVLRLHAGRSRYYLMFSATEPEQIDPTLVTQAQMRCCYTFSRSAGLLSGDPQSGQLSERERQCLFWVSEGKTSDEIAVILGVTANTVNSYITHAIRKFGAANRVQAVTTAIRSGII